MTTTRHRIDIATRREVAARHHIDHRTLDRAIQHGLDAIRAGMARDGARHALAELGLLGSEQPPAPPERA
jgi:hypothetical protein